MEDAILRKKLIALTLAVFVLSGALFAALWPVIDPTFQVDGFFADRVTIETREGSIHVEEDDMTRLKTLCYGAAHLSRASCPSHSLSVVFAAGEERLTVYPAGDFCGVLRIENNGADFFLFLNTEKSWELRRLLGRYGVSWPFS